MIIEVRSWSEKLATDSEAVVRGTNACLCHLTGYLDGRLFAHLLSCALSLAANSKLVTASPEPSGAANSAPARGLSTACILNGQQVRVNIYTNTHTVGKCVSHSLQEAQYTSCKCIVAT